MNSKSGRNTRTKEQETRTMDREKERVKWVKEKHGTRNWNRDNLDKTEMYRHEKQHGKKEEDKGTQKGDSEKETSD